MADGEVGNVLTQKVGPLPLVLWVVGGAGVIFVVMTMKNKGNSGSQGVTTNQVSALAPTEAEAFGTIEQQQQDVTNALTTLGNNQSALGGSMNTLAGIVTQQGQDNAASFQNLLNGQQTIEQGQASAWTANESYYNSLIGNLTNYFNSLGSQINGVNTNVSGVSGQVSANQSQVYTWLNQIASQIQGVSSQQQADAVAQRYGFANTDALLAYMFYQMPNRYAPMFPASPNPSQNQSTAEAPA